MKSLERYVKNLPNVLVCSDNKKIPAKSDRWILKKYALNKPYLVVNNPKRNHYATFDVDTCDSLYLWEIIGVPCPTLIVANKDSHSSHYLYEFINPLPERRLWSEKTVKLIESFCKYYCYVLQSHKVIIDQMQLSKNAMSAQWETWGGSADNCGVYSVSELAEYIKPIPKTASKTEADQDSRNCYLFNNSRRYAYSIVKDCQTEIEFYNRLDAYMVSVNEIEIPGQFPNKGKLESGEVKSTFKSISGWVWGRRSNLQLMKKADVNYGALGLDPMGAGWKYEDSKVEVKNRQKLSAEYCHRTQKEKTQHAIWLGIQQCRETGLEVTQKNVSECSGVPLRSVARHWYQMFANKTM
jgi:ribosomal protein L37AE/L43A